MSDTGRTLAICPSDGWFAVFLDDDNKPDVKGAAPVACWALMEGGSVEGLIDVGGYLESAQETKNFHRYRHKDDNDRTWS